MTSYNPLFDATAVSTPSGMTPAVAMGDIAGVPSRGTGLAGEVYITNGSIRSIPDLEQIIATRAPVSTFTATEIAYSGRESDTTIAEFLGQDAASIQGAPGNAFEMGPSGMVFTGFVFIPEGVHEIAIASDDGFKLSIAGVEFSEFEGTRGTDETARVADFAGGLYAVELLYFDASGGQSLNFQIDGITVDQSAFYQSTADFTSPLAGTPLVPAADYHPSYFLEDALDIATTDTPTEGADVIIGGGADETIDGLGGDDDIRGGYGDDKILGGDGDDVIDGGRGSDLIIGGAGNDLLISRSDGGEQRIGQLAIGEPTREDSPEGQINFARQKLLGYEDQPLIGDDIMVGGAGSDVFLIAPQINGTLEIIERHVRRDGTINWAGVAGENDYLHDHWVDLFGFDIIADYVKAEDKIAVIGHTATIHNIEYRDTDGDGDLESIVTVLSNQHGGGGAHDQDLLGILLVHGDLVEEDDIVTDAGVTYGIVETHAEVAEAIFPEGDLKVTTINGQEVFGYDTRDENGNLGPVTGSPEDFIDNPYLNDPDIVIGDPSPEGHEETRFPFEPLGTTDIAGETITGTGAGETIAPAEATPAGLPGALAFYDFADSGTPDGAFADARGGPTAKAYTLYENQALLRTDGVVAGPDGATLNALSFNGEDQYAFIAHDPVMTVTQGTIALFVRADDLSQGSTFLSKDQSGLGKGGHFRLGHTDDGQLLMRFADGDGRWGNQLWETTAPELTQGQWHHIAVNFQADGITVFVDGVAIPDGDWTRLEGDNESPGDHTEAYLLQNEEPWVLGADSYRAKVNDTAQIFAVDDEDLLRPFNGAIAEFGVWGGYTPEDALTSGEIASLIQNGPGAALTNPSGPQAMLAGNDVFNGMGGDDTILGEAGDDSLDGGAGADSIEGGYGNDYIDGGAGNDTLDGGRGSDYVRGGDGDDLLYARSDAGEQRVGQLVLGEPSRPSDGSIDPAYLKLVDWIDQPLTADDVLEGGAGNDTFYIQTQINGKKDIILKHIQDDRSVRWQGVAGENRYIHDHWVDLFGIDIIADFVRGEDQIKIIGHTTNILDITYKGYDSDGDGIDDDAMSIIQVYSQQGNGGGAHDEDMLGYAVVFGDLVYEDDIETDAGAHFGIVTSVDEIQEALAPTGETKVTFASDGTEIFGYDTRDIDGNPMAADPLAFSSNPFLAAGGVALASSLEATDPPEILFLATGGTFDGVDDVQILPHQTNLEQREGTWAFSFVADTPGEGEQTLLSKDHSGLQDGGHLNVYIHDNQYLYVRFQGTQETRTLKFSDERIRAGESYHVAFTFDADTIALYVNGEFTDADEGFNLGMIGNLNDTALGASTASRRDDDLRLKNFFDGTIDNIVVLDRALQPAEAVLLDAAGGDPDAVAAPTEIIGDEGDNVLVGSALSEIIMGVGGTDELHGNGGDDLLDAGEGGTGWQSLFGNEGSDTYLIGRSNGQVRIDATAEEASSSDTDSVVFTDLRLDEITLEALEAEMLGLNWTEGELNVADGGQDIERFEFADGSMVTSLYLPARHAAFTAMGSENGEVIHGGNLGRIFAGAGNDDISGAGQLFGQDGDDTYRIGKDGTEAVIAYETSGNDQVIFEDIDFDEITFSIASHTWSALGESLKASWVSDAGTAESLWIGQLAEGIESFAFADGSGASEIYRAPGHTALTAIGTEGGDVMHAGGLGRIFAGAGNDDISGAGHLYGQDGDDTYRIGRDGTEAIIAYETSGTDRVVFEDLSLGDLDFSLATHPWSVLGDSMRIGWMNDSGGQEILLIADSASGIESFEFEDGLAVSIYRAPGHSGFTVIGSEDDETLHAEGASRIFAGAGNDDISGAGQLFGQDGDDTYRIGKDGTEAVIAYETSGNDQVIFEDIDFDEITFSIASHTWSALGESLKASWVSDAGTAESLWIGQLAEGIESFAFADGSGASEIYRAPGHTALTAIGTEGGDVMHAGGLGRIFAGAGNDDISGAGHLYGQDGDDTYRIGRDGTEAIIAYETSGTDRVVFEDLAFDEIEFSFATHPWSELGEVLRASWVSDAGTTESLLIAQRAEGIERFEFDDGTVLTQDELIALV